MSIKANPPMDSAVRRGLRVGERVGEGRGWREEEGAVPGEAGSFGPSPSLRGGGVLRATNPLQPGPRVGLQ